MAAAGITPNTEPLNQMSRSFVNQLFDVLEVAAAAQIVHRDLRTQNLMVSDSGQQVVIDWGFAVCRGEDGSEEGEGEEFSPADFAGSITFGSDRVLVLLAGGATKITPTLADDLVSCTRICLDYLLDPTLRVCTPAHGGMAAHATLIEAAKPSLSHWSKAPVAWRHALDVAAAGNIRGTRKAVLSFYPSDVTP